MNDFLDKHSIAILDSLPEGVYVIDKSFKIRFVNKAGYELTRKSQKMSLEMFALHFANQKDVN